MEIRAIHEHLNGRRLLGLVDDHAHRGRDGRYHLQTGRAFIGRRRSDTCVEVVDESSGGGVLALRRQEESELFRVLQTAQASTCQVLTTDNRLESRSSLAAERKFEVAIAELVKEAQAKPLGA